MDILNRIVDHKKAEVTGARQKTPIRELENSQWFNRSVNSFTTRLKDLRCSGIIAEFKKKSPSKSNINLSALIEDVAPAYVEAGAAGLSILTDEHFFGGHNDFLIRARQLLPHTPLLRKEFIIDEYQILEAKSIGADMILLIAEILTKEEVFGFTSLARSLGLEVLLELHSESQLDKYCQEVSIVGVNNRDLKTFSVDYDRSKRLFNALPVDVPKIAESGLRDWQTLVMLHEHGFHGFLIGEQFMKFPDPGAVCRDMIDEFMTNRIKKQIVN